MSIKFTKENHAASLRKLRGLKNSFIQAHIFTESGNVDFTTTSFEYLISYAQTYYDFTVDIKVA